MKDYASWYVEIHPYQIGIEMSHRIATHLVPRIGAGNAVIVCDMPTHWLPTFRRRWNQVLKVLEREKEAATGSGVKAEYTSLLKSLRMVRFDARKPYERVVPTVWLVEPDALEQIPKGILTIYVMSGHIGMSQLLYWAKQMSDESAVLLFRKQPLSMAVPG